MKKYVVTGASRGIGRAACEKLIERGAQVVAIARDEGALRALAKTAPSQVIVMVGDLIDGEQRARIARACNDTVKEVHGVVHCAGLARHEPLVAMHESALRATFELNFFAPALLTRDLAGLVVDGGSMTFVSSTLASRTAMHKAAYAASKAALESFVRTAALELAPRVRVNAVAPGLVDTAMTRDLRLEPGEASPTGPALAARLKKQLDEMASWHPLGRMGLATEVADAILHLIDSKWSTGTVLTLDGGLSL